MDIRLILLLFAVIYFVIISLVFSAPVNENKKLNQNNPNIENKENLEKKIEGEIDDLGLEYGRYLQQVVEALEEDKDFAKKLENVSQEEIKNGAIARELNFVSHSVRTKLDELKRIELDRLRKLAKREHQLEEQIEEQRGNALDDGSDRRWRTLGFGEANNRRLDNRHIDPKTAGHLDHQNPHSFEADDLQKLILAATKDLEELDRKRREDFKQYEMEKEVQYRESLNNMTEEQRKETMHKREEMDRKHREHPRVHHPGSKQQLEQVWQEQDHMPKEEFNPKVFFQMHDVNGDGFLDPQEVEAILSLEIKKVYSEKNPEDDPNEMMEEYHRMREHIYKEADTNRDGLISKKEFLDFTHRMEFERDDGWKSLDENQVYSEEDLKQYESHRQQLQQQYGQYGAYQQQYVPQYYPQGYHPQQYGHQLHPQQLAQQQDHYQNPNQGYYPNDQHLNPNDVQHPNQGLHPQQQQQLLQQQGLHPQQQQQGLHPQQQQQLLQQQGLHPQQQQQLLQQQGLHPQQQQQLLQQQGLHPQQLAQQQHHEQQQALYAQQQQQALHHAQQQQQQQYVNQQIPQQPLHPNQQQVNAINQQQPQQAIHQQIPQQMPSNQGIPSKQTLNANQNQNQPKPVVNNNQMNSHSK